MKIKLFKESLRFVLFPFVFYLLEDRLEMTDMLAEGEAMALQSSDVFEAAKP